MTYKDFTGTGVIRAEDYYKSPALSLSLVAWSRYFFGKPCKIVCTVRTSVIPGLIADWASYVMEEICILSVIDPFSHKMKFLIEFGAVTFEVK